jgi:autotransporter-associated beta strand protein
MYTAIGTLQNCANKAFGGAIYNNGGRVRVVLTNSTVVSNSAAASGINCVNTSRGGGVCTECGAVDIDSSTLTGNFTEADWNAASRSVGAGIALLGGRLTLAGTNSYDTNTVFSAGTLAINGSTTGTVSGPTSTTLAGLGTIDTAIVNVGATVAPGDGASMPSIGTLAAGSLTMNGGAILQCELIDANGTPGIGWDTLQISGDLGINTTALPVIIRLKTFQAGAAGIVPGFHPAAPALWVIASCTGNLNGFAPERFYVDTTGFLNPIAGSFSVQSYSGQLAVRYTPTNLWPALVDLTSAEDLLVGSSANSPFN